MKYKLEMQFFGDEDRADNDNAPIITFDELLADKFYQSEYDKKMTKGINTATEKLKKEIEDLAEFKEKYSDMEKEFNEFKTTATQTEKQIKKETAIQLALAKSGTRDEVSLKAHLNDFIEKAEVDEDGKLKGINEKIGELKQSHEFLFGTTKATGFELGKGDAKKQATQTDTYDAFGVKYK